MGIAALMSSVVGGEDARGRILGHPKMFAIARFGP